jgi:heme exporter protein B
MFRTALLVAAKDLRIELRSRVLLWQVLPFGVIALLLSGLAVGPRASVTRNAAPGLFFVVILLVSLLMIGRSHSIEARRGTHSSIKMLGLDPAGVFLGKAFALFVTLGAAALVLLCGVVLLMHAPLGATLRALGPICLALGSIAAGGTLYGALSGDAENQATLLPIIALPPLAGVLVAGEKAFAACINGTSNVRWQIFLAIGLVAYLAVGILLYGVAEESA